jgi:hypothetical protein
MLRIPTLKALRSTFGRGKSKDSCFEHIKGGALAEARANVKCVHRQVADLEQSCEWHELDEGHPTKRIVWGFFNAVRHHERALTGYSEEDVEAMDALERESNNLVAAASTLYAIDPALFQVRVGVSLLAGVRGLDSKEAFERYLADLKMIAEDRRERAAHREKVLKEGYTDRKGKEHSPAKIAAKAERGRQRNAMTGGRDVALESRTSATGQGLQNEEANKASMRSRQDRDIKNARRLRDAIDAAHTARNALPPPPGAERAMRGYAVRSRLVPPGELNPATWDRAEIERRVAEFRERLGVPERVPGTYVHPDGDGYRVVPPVAELRKLRREGKAVYNEATRSCTFLDKDEAVVAYEKFMAPSTSDDERKEMLEVPPEAKICAYCDHAPFDRISTRVQHEKYHCKSRPGAPESSSSSSEEEEESDEDESEEVVAPPPKRARLWWLWPSSE